MLAVTEIVGWHWAAFISLILVFLALDLGVFHKKAHVVQFKEALGWTILWFLMAMAFAGLLFKMRGRQESLEFVTGYILELSLSMDNVFVIALIFSYFRVPLEHQHRVLFWGIIGALVMRGIMIGLGALLIKRVHEMLYVFGAFLIFTGFKMLFSKDEGVHPEKNPVIRLAQKLFPVSNQFDGQKFLTQWNGRLALTPLALVLLMVETTDLIFAVDSIPAIFAVTDNEFIIFTSNVFAILGLRSLYFVLANAIGYFRYLKYGLSIVLIFIGAKMFLPLFGVQIPSVVALIVVISLILISIIISVLASKFSKKS